MHGYLLSRIDHSIGAISALEVIEIRREDFEAATDTAPSLLPAFWRHDLVSRSCQREWIVNIGARNALERIAHLLCEVYARLTSSGNTQSDSCAFPLTQQDIGDAVGLTSVHVNRSLQELRKQALIKLDSKNLTIRDHPGLRKIGQFSMDYLHQPDT